MEIKDNKTQIPLAHYRVLFAQADPEEIAARTGVHYDPQSRCFTLEMMAAKLEITWPDGGFHFADNVHELSEYTSILPLRFLLEALPSITMRRSVPMSRLMEMMVRSGLVTA